MRNIILFFLFGIISLSGCAINPVTGSRELVLVSESQEIAVGQENYIASRQMQGGDYMVDPALTEYVNEVGQRLARVSDRKLPYEFVVLNNSVPNAWALPGGKIAINRGLLLELKNEAELAAVLGHEIVHAAARHGAKSMERGLLLQGAIAAAGIATQGENYAKYAVGGARAAAGLIHTKYGRDAEREADYYGMQYMSRAGYDPIAAVGLQETFVRLAKGRSKSWLSGLFASHPPSEERVAANRKTAGNFAPGGLLATAQYQNKIGSIKRMKDAYQALDKGRKELKKNNPEKARAFAEKALMDEPREGYFHALLGDVNFSQKRYQDALNNYNRSVELPGDFFYFYLQRGLTLEKLGDRNGASQDLKASVKLLPTAIAFNALGNIELAAGNRQRAKEYFRTASGSGSEPGRQALQSLVRLEIPDNPSRYVRVRIGLDKEGYVIVELANLAPLTVGRIRLQLNYPDAQGTRRISSRLIENNIPAGKSIRVQLGLGPLVSPTALQMIELVVIEARIIE